MKQIDNVCSECGIEANRLTCIQKYGYPPKKACFDVSTYHLATCDVCGRQRMVTEPRDFFYPDFSLLISDNQIKMLQLMFDVDPEFNFVFYVFFDELKLPLAVLKKEMAGLRKMGLVEFAKGLLDEEGYTAGAGNGIVYSKRETVKKILDKPVVEHKSMKPSASKLDWTTTPAEDKNKELLPTGIKEAVKDIVWMARRYADGRKTGAPELFNNAYAELKKYIEFDEANDPDNRTDESRPVKNFPLATRGEYK